MTLRAPAGVARGWIVAGALALLALNFLALPSPEPGALAQGPPDPTFPTPPPTRPFPTLPPDIPTPAPRTPTHTPTEPTRATVTERATASSSPSPTPSRVSQRTPTPTSDEVTPTAWPDRILAPFVARHAPFEVKTPPTEPPAGAAAARGSGRP